MYPSINYLWLRPFFEYVLIILEIYDLLVDNEENLYFNDEILNYKFLLFLYRLENNVD